METNIKTFQTNQRRHENRQRLQFIQGTYLDGLKFLLHYCSDAWITDECGQYIGLWYNLGELNNLLSLMKSKLKHLFLLQCLQCCDDKWWWIKNELRVLLEMEAKGEKVKR